MVRIYVAVACHNRKRTAEVCLPTLRAALGPGDVLALYNDGSTEYDTPWLRQWADRGIGGPNIGIEAQRRNHLRDFWSSDAQWLYFTDHDAIHDPAALTEGLRLAVKYGAPITCLYNTHAHVRLVGNLIEDWPREEVIWRRVAPGISYLMSRETVAKILPHLGTLTAFDWQIPAILGHRCAVSRVSYVDHLGHGGLRHPPLEGWDGGDRALNPTPFLVAKRAEIVKKLETNL